MTHHLGVLTTGRQDWGVLRSTCKLLQSDPRFELSVFAGGMHYAAGFGRTVTLLEEDGFHPAAAMPWLPDDVEMAVGDQAGDALKAVAEALSNRRVDALFLVGDRYETAAAAVAATVSRVPLIHLHGGEETLGAFDNALRNAITKLSHLHLVSHPLHAERVIAMGEDPGSVHVVGAPGLDNLHRDDLATRQELEQHLQLSLADPLVVVALHPTTLADDAMAEVRSLVQAIDQVPATYVITMPNSDPNSEAVRRALGEAARRPRRVAVGALGERRFWGLLRIADAMLGNSSSAVIEAPILKLPAVNIGDRQKGRLRATNLIDVPPDAGAISAALEKAIDPRYRATLSDCASPFGDGYSAQRIVRLLAEWRAPNPPVKTNHTVKSPS